MSKTKRPEFDLQPPALPLAGELKVLGFDVGIYTKPPLNHQGDLERYRAEMWDDLSQRTVGNHDDDILEVWRHAVESKRRPIAIQAEVRARGGLVSQRQNFAAVNVQAAAQTLEVALLMHTAKDTWYATAVISLCRIALELAAKAVFIATGARDEPGRWRSAHVIRDTKRRRAAQIKMGECLDVLQPLLNKRYATADDAGEVYAWLCGFVHFDARTLTKMPTHETAFAAVAYVGWVVAVATEVVTGLQPIAEWPRRWPSKLPWR